MQWTLYSAFVGTIGSIVGHSYIAISEHNPQKPKTFSELAAAERHILTRFRWTALTCSTLLGITVYWFIVPRNHLGLFLSLAWSLEYFAGILMLIFPAKDKFISIHNICANAMAIGMLILAYLFLPALSGVYFILGLGSALAITIFGIAAIVDRRRFLIHELGIIFVSHISICIAALGLR